MKKQKEISIEALRSGQLTPEAAAALVEAYNAKIKWLERLEQSLKLLESRSKRLSSRCNELVEENARLQRFLDRHEQTERILHATISDQANHITWLDSEVRKTNIDVDRKQEEIEKLYARSLWQRIWTTTPE